MSIFSYHLFLSFLEMLKCAMRVAKLNVSTTVEERNLFHTACKIFSGSRRASWRIASSIEQKEKIKGAEFRASLAEKYRLKIEREFLDGCHEIISVLDDHLIKFSQEAESRLFFQKM